MNENIELQSEYFELVFGTPRPKRKWIKAALNRAHEIRQFEIRLYWQRSLFFWGFVITLFTGFGVLLNNDSRNLDQEMAMLVISLLGLFICVAWFYVEKGSKAWQANWELHIDYLENDITGNLHKTALGNKVDFYSVSKINRSTIIAFIIVWLMASMYAASILIFKFQSTEIYSLSLTASNGLESLLAGFLVLLIIIVLAIVICICDSIKTRWKTTDETWGQGNDHFGLRYMPKINFTYRKLH